jgi:RNA polymerase sigma-70 factor (ECF subfamily)
VAIAFLAALQNLPPLQRAVLILRDVLGFAATETAEALETSVAAVNGALQRARATLETRRDRLEAGTLSADDARTEALLRRYVAAWESGDPQALAALLREDATLSMPPVPTWYSGREAIRTFLAPLLKAMGTFRLRATSANGLPACAAWLRAPGETVFRAQAIQVVSADERGVSRLDVFMNPALFKRFGLPAEL